MGISQTDPPTLESVRVERRGAFDSEPKGRGVMPLSHLLRSLVSEVVATLDALVAPGAEAEVWRPPPPRSCTRRSSPPSRSPTQSLRPLGSRLSVGAAICAPFPTGDDRAPLAAGARSAWYSNGVDGCGRIDQPVDRPGALTGCRS